MSKKIMVTLVICIAILSVTWIAYSKSKEKEPYVPTGQYLP